MIKAKVSTDYKDIERIFAGGSIQKEILKVWSTEADAYVFETWKILEMEGPLPLTFKANGEPLIDYRIYGNTVQNGTPTPENPIMPIGCSERTENLFDENYENISTAMIYKSINVGSGSFTLSTNTPLGTGGCSLFLMPGQQSSGATTAIYGAYAGSPRTGTSVDGYVTVVYRIYDNKDPRDYQTILNTGSTPLPYEPYGYKLPIHSNSTVTNIYLGEVETTRRIKKLVLTGEETWSYYSATNAPFKLNLMEVLSRPLPTSIYWVCSHYEAVSNSASWASYDSCISWSTADGSSGLRFRDIQYSNLDDFKNYIAQQYANGTPVTVWYVLVTPTTGIVNEPLMKIGNYADTIDRTQAGVSIPTSKGTTTIDYDGEEHFITSDGYELIDKNQNGILLSGSTLRPSKMYIKYKGR